MNYDVKILKYFSQKECGFTLIETIVSLVIFGLLISATSVLFKYQTVSTNQIEEMSEMQDNVRTVSYWLTKDIREAIEIEQLGNDTEGKGPGPGKDNAFKIIHLIEGERKTISYFYGTESKPNTLYRDVDGSLQPLTNEYFYGGSSKGYVRGWSLEFFDENGGEIKNNEIDKVKKIRRVDFTIKGGYLDKPDDYSIKSSVAIRKGL